MLRHVCSTNFCDTRAVCGMKLHCPATVQNVCMFHCTSNTFNINKCPWPSIRAQNRNGMPTVTLNFERSKPVSPQLCYYCVNSCLNPSTFSSVSKHLTAQNANCSHHSTEASFLCELMKTIELFTERFVSAVCRRSVYQLRQCFVCIHLF